MKCVGPKCLGCSDPQCYAEGGHVKGVHEDTYDGMSDAGLDAREADAHKDLGESEERAERVKSAKEKHLKVLKEMLSMTKPKLMAEGGDVSKHHPLIVAIMKKKFAEGGKVKDEQKGVHKEAVVAGESMGGAGMSLAGQAARIGHSWAKQEHRRVLNEMKGMKKPNLYSEGGRVANEDDDIVDFEDNQFDDLALRDDLEGEQFADDEIGDEREDHDREDIIRKAMASWAKKDRMPRPA